MARKKPAADEASECVNRAITLWLAGDLDAASDELWRFPNRNHLIGALGGYLCGFVEATARAGGITAQEAWAKFLLIKARHAA